jgi:hypothetical protein
VRLVLLLLALTATAAATGALTAPPYKAPRNAFGAPDLQGVWTSGSITLLQRPKDFKALVATPYEAAAYEKKRRQRYETGVAPTKSEAPAPAAGEVEDESAQWQEAPPGLARVRGEIRTSWIVDPKDGKLPFTEASRAASEKALKAEEVFDDPETRPFDERCLLGGGGGVAAPMINRDLTQIVQTRDRLVIHGEQNHEARIVRIGDKHLPAAMAPWMGDSIGWWEGDTLVVETTKLSPNDRWRWNAGDWIPISAGAKVTERFEKVGPGELIYSFTVEDPANYTQAWRGEIPLHASQKPIFEFACHEGNYALTNILRGGRSEDRAKAAVAGRP